MRRTWAVMDFARLPLLKKQSWPELSFWLVSFVYMFGLIGWQHTFAKLGFTLPSELIGGQIAFQPPKLFVTELYIIFCTALVLIFYRSSLKKYFLGMNDICVLLTLFLFTYGCMRMFVEIGKNPLLVIRNSAFCWYLFFSLMVACLPFRKEHFERFFQLIIMATLLYYTYHQLLLMKGGHSDSNWVPFIGGIPFIVLALQTKKSFWFYLAIVYTAINMGFDLQIRMQRTVWVGMIFALPLFLWHMKLPKQKMRKAMIVFIAAFAISFFTYKLPALWGQPIITDRGTSNPWVKAAASEMGFELFRMYQWEDAAKKFLAHPIAGIGMHNQVVEKIFIGRDQFVANTGGWEHPDSPPISGPHNSYLNAAARLGFLGFLFLALHAMCLIVLLQKRYYHSAALLCSGIIYAIFNIGLEGPKRSFLLLFAMGFALKLALESPQFSTQAFLRKIRKKNTAS